MHTDKYGDDIFSPEEFHEWMVSNGHEKEVPRDSDAWPVWKYEFDFWADLTRPLPVPDDIIPEFRAAATGYWVDGSTESCPRILCMSDEDAVFIQIRWAGWVERYHYAM